MVKVRGKYTPEFQRQAVAMMTNQRLSVAEVARRLSISESRLHESKKAALIKGIDAFPGSGHQPPSRRNSDVCGPRSSGWRWSVTSGKSDGVLRQPSEVIFAWIEERRHDYPITVLCRVLGVSRSGFYAWVQRPPSEAVTRRETLVANLRAVHAEMKGRYGSPRLAIELNERGVACGVNTVAKVMKAHGIRAKTVRRFVRTTDSNHRMPVAENVLDRDFSPARPNAAWGMDITYVPTLEGWLFLALVVDWFSRRIVGWSMAATMTSRLVVDALDMAASRRGPPTGLVAHSDRGSQYASDHYQTELRRRGMACSMSGVGPCWDNAVVESTFGSLKRELCHHEAYATRSEAIASVFESIEVFYNRVRWHSTLGYVSPVEYERTHNPKLR